MSVLSVWPAMYICGVCKCSVCSTYWDYIFSLTTDWTWGYGAASASPLSGCQIQHDTFSSNINALRRQSRIIATFSSICRTITDLFQQFSTYISKYLHYYKFKRHKTFKHRNLITTSEGFSYNKNVIKVNKPKIKKRLTASYSDSTHFTGSCVYRSYQKLINLHQVKVTHC